MLSRSRVEGRHFVQGRRGGGEQRRGRRVREGGLSLGVGGLGILGGGAASHQLTRVGARGADSTDGGWCGIFVVGDVLESGES